MIDLIQVLAVVFAVFAWSRALLRFRDRKISPLDFVFWTVVWAGVAFAAVFPASLKSVSALFGVGRPVDIIVYVSIAVLFYLVFRLYVKLEQVRMDVTGVVREMALLGKRKK